jgi:hypothetical protein
MAEPLPAPMVKMICGMLSSRTELLEAAVRALETAFGPTDVVSEVMDFDFTHYYDAQMGSPLYRQFVAFDRLAPADRLAKAKLTTNAIERQFAESQTEAGQPAIPRPINLDVGYVEPAKLILASMKNFSHRIYLGRGVFAEVTLLYHPGRWDALGWTFPDYASGRYDAFLTEARNRLRAAQKESAA